MTDNEIIKELNLRIDNFSREALDLINRQKAEIESLKHRKTELQIRNQELQHEKSEAIKEFAEELKRKAAVVHKTHSGKYWYEIDDDEIDNLVKEMTE